jgi:AP-3 complex subunit delta-1
VKYLGLLAMSKILQTNPKAVQTHKDLIMQCLDDKDESIRLRSLDLLYGMVSKKNLMEIIKKLMVHMNKAEGTHYRDELLAKIIDICSQNNYQYVTNFEWYVSVLVELTRMEGTRHGKLLSSQMLDVAIRVELIRPFIVTQMAILLDNIHVFTTVNTSIGLKTGKNSTDICEVLFAATWICGEFAVYLSEPFKTMDAMLKSKVTNLPGHIQSVFVQNIFKIYVHIICQIYAASNELESDENENSEDFRLSSDGLEECKRITAYVTERMQLFEQSADIEVQERACAQLQILKYVQKIFDKQSENEELCEARLDLELKNLFEGELNPVAPKAQKKVPVPEGLDLDEWINDPPSDIEDNEMTSSNEAQIFVKSDQPSGGKQFNSLSSAGHGKNANYSGSSSNTGGFGSNSGGYSGGSVGAKSIQPELSQEELNKLRETRKIETENNPFYIKSVKVILIN